MEFVNQSEIVDLLRNYGCEEVTEGEDRVRLSMQDQEGVVHLHLATETSTTTPRDGAKVMSVPTDELPSMIERIIHGLNLSDLLLIPVAKWRKVFDAVAFSLAANEEWQEFDATATVELNTRDPLLCGPADHPLVVELVRALISDAEGPDQGLMLTSTGVPVLAEIIPDGSIRLSFGNQVLADEFLDTVST
ncbi:MAG: hypothetical protein ACYTJ0_16195 [Planctomycetota bacterium]